MIIAESDVEPAEIVIPRRVIDWVIWWY